MKTCFLCKQSKPLSDFHNRTSSKDGKQGMCKMCNIARVKAWQTNNPEKHEINWKRSTANRNWFQHKAKQYNIDMEELEKMFEGANGVCNICKQAPDRWLVIDHCHNSLKIRGLLCERCNQALGLFKDSPEVLSTAIEYLNNDLTHNEYKKPFHTRKAYTGVW